MTDLFKRLNEKRREEKLVRDIYRKTVRENLDNISRTKAYEAFYFKHPEVRWAFLAGMVSRNAGYNMTDLRSGWFQMLLDKEKRDLLFLTYEKANWLIFQDAFPQLLVYEASKTVKKPLFHLLNHFKVSAFMQIEWDHFWNSHDIQRLVTALIINEQNVIQQPVIEHPVLRKKVFRSLPFKFEERLHFSTVLFPTCDGELYGYSVYQFRQLTKRIELGKKLAHLLFYPELIHKFEQFAKKTEPTGSRRDYEHYLLKHAHHQTPLLRVAFPIVSHEPHLSSDWYDGWIKSRWFAEPWQGRPSSVTDWYFHKQKQLHFMIAFKQRFILSES